MTKQLKYFAAIVLMAKFLITAYDVKAQLKVTSAGKVGIGNSAPTGLLELLNTTHTNPNTTYSSLYAGTFTTLFRNAFDSYIFANSYYNSSNNHIYSSNGGAASIWFNQSGAGNIDFYSAPSGTAGNTVTYTKRVTINGTYGYVGIGTASPSAKLEVNGTSEFNDYITVTGDINGTGSFNYISDQIFKTEIDSIQNALSIIQQLKPRTYYFDTLNFNEFNFSSKKRYGFIAQDMEQVLPELVNSVKKYADYDTLGNIVHPETTYKAVNYIEIIGILTKGIQEQQQKIDSLSSDLQLEKANTNTQDSINAALQNQLTQLLETINSCCTIGEIRSSPSSGTYVNQTDIKLTNAQSVVLEQNVPNPFADQTSINYYLPDNTQKAQLLFYNAQGRLIQSTDLSQKGKGVVNVFASDLSNGIYTYTLVVDGKIIETKKMVKQ